MKYTRIYIYDIYIVYIIYVYVYIYNVYKCNIQYYFKEILVSFE